MTEPLTPQTIELLIAGYVVGNLTSPELEEFEQLLTQHPELTQEVKQLDEICDRLICGLHEVQPPPDLWSTIATVANNSVQQVPRARSPYLSWKPIWGSIAILLILGLGIDNYRLRQELNAASEINVLLQNSQTRLFPLKHITPNFASGSFVVNLAQGKGILTLQDLPIPPQGYVYRLWVMVDRDQIPCGIVNINTKGLTSEQFFLPIDLYEDGISGVFITLESSQLSRYPTGSIVMQNVW